MTKSIVITYDEADETLLMAFFNRLKIKIMDTHKTTSLESKKLALLNEIRGAVEEMHAHQRGETDLPSWDDMMRALEAQNLEN